MLRHGNQMHVKVLLLIWNNANIMQFPMIIIYTVLITLCNNLSLLVDTHPSHIERGIKSTYNMDDVTYHRGDKRRLYWTPKMCVNLLHCRDMARQFHCF